MIELTTSIVFLVTSLYGGANGSAMPEASATNASTSPVSTTVITVQIDRNADAKTIENYVREQYKNTPILVEVARCESTFRQYDKDGNAIRGKVNKADIGVMQINEKYHLERSKELGLDIHTVEGNVAYAKLLYADQGAAPWKASSPCWGKTTTSDQVAMK